MSKLHGKSVLLGIGIGTILTAILGLIFFLGYTPELDEARVKELAREYGMVEPGDFPVKATIEISEEDTVSDVTAKLQKAGIIKKADGFTFQTKLVSSRLQDKIKPGVYEFNGGESEEEIISILTAE